MKAKAEWHRLRKVMIHRPGTEVDYAMLAPSPFLFERPFRVRDAIKEHENLEEVMKGNGVRVELLSDLVSRKSDSRRTFRKLLEDKILKSVVFYGNKEDTGAAKAELKRNLPSLDSLTLFNILTLEPSVDLKRETPGFTKYPTIYSNIPLANLYFMRDQQAVGSKGVVIGRMKKEQRMRETEITEFVIRFAFGEKSIAKIDENGFFEGGDFIPADDFCLIGTGQRTDENGAFQAINSDVLDYDEYCVIENPEYSFPKSSKSNSMINMHLDTYFNIAGDGVAVGSVETMKKAIARVYTKDDGKATSQEKTTLYDYLRSKDFSIIDLTLSEQLSYSSNFLTISDKKIIVANVSDILKLLMKGHRFPADIEKRISKELNANGRNRLFPNRNDVRDLGIDYQQVELSQLTGGYGGAHCMTASLER